MGIETLSSPNSQLFKLEHRIDKSVYMVPVKTGMRTVLASGSAALALAATTLPALGFAVAPVFEHAVDTWQEVGPLSRFTDSDYLPEVITIAPGVGEAGRSIAYVRRHNAAIDGPPKDKYDHVIAISSRCVHVGCPVTETTIHLQYR